MMIRGFRRHPTAVQRFFPVVPSGETYHFFNLHLNHLGVLCGNFASYTAGHNQPIMALDQNADHLEVAQIEAGSIRGRRAEFLEAILFFAVFGNSVILLQTNLLKAPQVERYLKWWLRDTLGLIGEDQSIFLSDPVPTALARRRVRRVKRVQVRRNMELHARPISGSDSFAVEPERDTRTLLEWLAPSLLRDLNLRRYVDADKIRATVVVEWMGQPPAEETPVLDEIARDLPDDEDLFEIELADGTKIRADELKKTKEVSLLHEGSIPVFDMLFDRMAEWHQELLEAPPQ